jgi:hypothetical protein
MPYEENYEAMYGTRFKFFKNIPAPTYIPYDDYDSSKQNEQEKDVSELLKNARDWMRSGKDRLA